MADVPLFSPLLERALRVAAESHREQHRKGTGLPYITHPVAVAMILQRTGFTEEPVLAAALLHDVVEDTDYTMERMRSEFAAPIPEIVAALTERKLDAAGKKRPWRDRKEEHLAHIATASVEARAIALADKLHNLKTIAFDLAAGHDVWPRFNAPREDLLWYHRAMVEAAGTDDIRLAQLAAQCRDIIRQLEADPK